MKIPLSERGNYYRGLLVLVRRDREIDTRERELMVQFGQVLDFDKRFCEAAIGDLMGNKHIQDDPVTFSDRAIAECFLRDAILLALVDGDLHPKEVTWLKAIADANRIDDQWLQDEIVRLGGLSYPCLEFGSSSTGSVRQQFCCESTRA